MMWRIRRFDEVGFPEPVPDIPGGDCLRHQWHEGFWCKVVRIGKEVYLRYERQLRLVEVSRAAGSATLAAERA